MNHLLIERDSHVETWTLNQPEKRNPITDDETIDAIEAAIFAANADTDLRCVVLTGAGKGFSSGGNVKDIEAGKGYFGASPFFCAEGYRTGIQRIPRAMHRLEVPVVAAVNGAAIGAGCDLTLMCDLRIASTQAIFAESFVKLGLVPGDGGAWLLPRVIGHARATEMTLTGEPIDARRALEWGLVSQVVEPDELLGAARSLAERIAVNPPLAVRMAKRLLRDAQQQSLDSILELSATLQAAAHGSADHKSAMSAMMSRTPGTYVGG